MKAQSLGAELKGWERGREKSQEFLAHLYSLQVRELCDDNSPRQYGYGGLWRTQFETDQLRKHGH